MITNKTLSFFITPEVLNSNPLLKINKITSKKDLMQVDHKWKCISCNKEIYHPVAMMPLIHCRCEYENWDFDNQSLYIQKIYRDEKQQDLVAIKIGITKQDGNVRKNFTDSFSIYHHKLFFEVRMAYALAAKIEARIKRELPVGFISKAEMQDGYTETASPDCLDQMLAIYEEEIATTQLPF
ncbi:hypothetical protein ERHA55_29420 [Erwinia rhapontici]|uniref:Uncharacterized protein n=1 Tax=Erwinia rhapontici TaxID=55212 RepID=A0ABM7N1E1_ERWRD|nr:hypothetical protein [Erwinia rhapontici]BCQ35271.1 hypothetical protein ERHA53_26140 [Erwinia rhapontici]BCQ45415.1 hypothetical protein ERHA55_29420 [Erwinia rhapontici]